MPYGFMDIARSPSVRAAQEAMGAAHLWDDFAGNRTCDRFTQREAAFIAARDSFYMASVSETGWPYVQHRGGPPGFLKLLDDRTMAFADYRGNRQYISTGNIAADGRVCLFLMDYARRARLKIYARAEAVPVDAMQQLTEQVTVPGYRANIERIFCLRLEAFDWNCSQHIPVRYTAQEVQDALASAVQRIEQLEAENSDLRKRCGETE